MTDDLCVFRDMGNEVRGAFFLDEGGAGMEGIMNFCMEPPGFRKPGGGYASFSKDIGHTKTWKVLETFQVSLLEKNAESRPVRIPLGEGHSVGSIANQHIPLSPVGTWCW